MKQNTLKPTPGSTRSKKRIGRGGPHGTYAGRGVKGQKARTGGNIKAGFEGGQTPLLRRMPKIKGFRSPNKVYYFPINLGTLDKLFDDGAKVNVKALIEKKIMKKEQPLKLLGTGDLKKKLEITVDLASASAIKKVEKAGGKLTILKAKTAKADKES